MPKTEIEMTLAGHKIAELLHLKPKGGLPVHYDTAWGTKTALGLYLSITRIIEETNSDTYSLKG